MPSRNHQDQELIPPDDENTHPSPQSITNKPLESGNGPSIDDIRSRLLKKSKPAADLNSSNVSILSSPKVESSGISSQRDKDAASMNSNDSDKKVKAVPKVRLTSSGTSASVKSPPKIKTTSAGDSRQSTLEKKQIEQSMANSGCAQHIALGEDLLTYCSLLDRGRTKATSEALTLRTTVRELEHLLDEARQREIQHLEQSDQHRQNLAQFEKKYYNLKVRVKALLKECQEQRDNFKTENDELKIRKQDLETDIYAAKSLAHNQRIELDRLHELTRNMPSEKELTEFNLKLRRLENENGVLATERAKLMQQIDELQTHGVKGREDRQSPMTKSAAEQKARKTIEQLEEKISRLYESLADAENEKETYKEYATVLLEKLDAAGISS